ncbi:DNA cytosine methyltransferase [Rhizobium leguminosarum]|uniref:DNA cytosine methyltransferase n=1 Tax=Rhizobium leguminosarum TaxID=384 RepID=UPI001040D497|nr:DNA (cytosine-5-)-methyltransferase [Rhizobium leguminosarum]TBZ12191.1 DNA (cytosine-5-)-methyltransferase [Rhizobium leguminosarum bv. viciae]
MPPSMALKAKMYVKRGTSAPWYKGRDLTDEQRNKFRATTIASQAAKAKAVNGECVLPKHPIPVATFNPLTLMPEMAKNGFSALSMFSGCGGLDIGFDRAGFKHVASYDILPEAEEVLNAAHPDWKVFAGDNGDVTQVNWKQYRGEIDVLHGGPPCQPFSHAGHQNGSDDERDMVPELIRAALEAKPRAFILENVSGLATKKFASYVKKVIFDAVEGQYHVHSFLLEAADFGVPQRRKRVFFVGFRNKADFDRFERPLPTHSWDRNDTNLPATMGVREALGLPSIGVDALAPTIRSGWTGPRHTTSIVNSATSMKQWDEIAVWPNGVAADREAAAAFVAKNGHFRLSIQDCMLLQGFPESWPIQRPVYKALGLIGNSVAPPMAYAVAASVAEALGIKRSSAQATA